MNINNIVNEAIYKTNTQNIKQLVTKIVDLLVFDIKQEMIRNVQASCYESMHSLFAGLQEKIIAKCQKWLSLNIQEPILPILPDNIKYYNTFGNHSVVVIEHKPQVRSMSFLKELLDGCANKVLSEKTQICAISLPYLVFTIGFRNNIFFNLYVNFRTKPLISLEDIVCYPALPNFGGSRMCFGKILTDDFVENLANMSLVEQVNEIINTFYRSSFNTDYPDNYRYICEKNPQMATLRQWIASSRENPGFILKIDFRDCKTLQEMVSDALNGGYFLISTNLSDCFNDYIEEHVTKTSEQTTKWLQESVADCVQVDRNEFDNVFQDVFYNTIKVILDKVLKDLQKDFTEK